MVVVGCTKTRFTLVYKRRIDLPVLCLTAKFPPKTAGNCLTKKLFNYLFFWVWFKKYYFFAENRPKTVPKMAQISQKLSHEKII